MAEYDLTQVSGICLMWDLAGCGMGDQLQVVEGLPDPIYP